MAAIYLVPLKWCYEAWPKLTHHTAVRANPPAIHTRGIGLCAMTKY